jgi:hypothetical protein
MRCQFVSMEMKVKKGNPILFVIMESLKCLPRGSQ